MLQKCQALNIFIPLTFNGIAIAKFPNTKFITDQKFNWTRLMESVAARACQKAVCPATSHSLPDNQNPSHGRLGMSGTWQHTFDLPGWVQLQQLSRNLTPTRTNSLCEWNVTPPWIFIYTALAFNSCSYKLQCIYLPREIQQHFSKAAFSNTKKDKDSRCKRAVAGPLPSRTPSFLGNILSGLLCPPLCLIHEMHIH